MGIPIPDEPQRDVITDYVINAFWQADRGRRFITGMGAPVPLPLSPGDVNDVVSAYGCLLERKELDACIFAIDAIYRGVDTE